MALKNKSWQETKHGLFKEYSFDSFSEALNFIRQAGEVFEEQKHYPRWQNEGKVINIWLATHNDILEITGKDKQIAKQLDDLVKADPSPSSDKTKKRTGHKASTIKMYADGGSRGNPGPSASGFVLFDENDNILVDQGVYLGITTNNQAEYTALKLGLEEAKKLQANTVHVFMDSLLVVNQMKGIFKVRNRDLWPIHQAIAELSGQFKLVTYQHVPRELNKLADAAVNRALDERLKK